MPNLNDVEKKLVKSSLTMAVFRNYRLLLYICYNILYVDENIIPKSAYHKGRFSLISKIH